MEKQEQLHQVVKSWSPYARMPARTRASLNRLWSRMGFSHEFATILRYEMDMLMLRVRCSLSPGYRRQVRDLGRRKNLLIHLGCGNVLLDGWVNTDCYPPGHRTGAETLTLDMRGGLPLADGSATAIYTEHFFEHLSFDVVRLMLSECYRILAPSGTFRLGVPDGEYFARQYLSDDEEAIHRENRGDRTRMMMLNALAHASTHKFLWDYETFELVFREAGFTAIRHAVSGDSEVAHFAGKDRQDPWRRRHTLYLEARKAG